MAIAFDGAAKVITLDTISVQAAEVWSRWVDWYALNSNWVPALLQVGGEALGDGLYNPVYFFLLNGWRVRPMEADHNLKITGNLFVDGGGVPVINTIGAYQVNVNYTVPVMAQGIATSGGTGPTSEQIAAVTWASLLEGGMSARDVLRILLAVAAGDATGLEGDSPAFKAIDGVKTRVAATYLAGNRTVTARDAS